jgi:signal recognition particle receptor subunit beta
MVQINFAQRQVNAKIVYYGPGMSGKTTNLEVIHQRAPDQNRGELTSISTDGDRTLFFDFMPLDLGMVAGMRTCFQIYTVPGQVYYNSTRKLVLQGVDGVVFVADSSASMVEDNLESLRNLEENLNEYGKSLATLPHVIQFNKRDLPDALPVDQLNQVLNLHAAPTYEAIASTGQGVFPTLKALAARVLESIHTGASPVPNAPTAPAAQPVQRAAPPPPPSLPARPAVGVQSGAGAGFQPAATGVHAAPAARAAQPGAPAGRGPIPMQGHPAPQDPHRAGTPPQSQRPLGLAQTPVAPPRQSHGGTAGLPPAAAPAAGAGEGLHPRPAPDLNRTPARAPATHAPRTPRGSSRGSSQGGSVTRAKRGKPSTLEGTRFRPRSTSRSSALPTPTRRSGNNKLVAGVIVAVSLVVGVVLAQVVFSLF